jgi:hypothetical protein
MADLQEEGTRDLVRVATCQTPTEAHLLRGVLQAAGLTPYVADANIVQVHAWLTQAVGGVRVLVPSAQLKAAQEAIADFHAGAYQLEGEEMPSPVYRSIGSPVFCPERAVFLSFALTPVFGAAVHVANASISSDNNRLAYKWIWLFVLAAFSAAGIIIAHQIDSGPLVVFRASLSLSFITLVWYFIEGQEQSRYFLKKYGPKYEKKGLTKLSFIVIFVMLGLGWALSEFA